ncbi:MAG: post-transcriptional regulator [Culicoidibacterales bacterium]
MKISNEFMEQFEFLLVCKVNDFHSAGYSDVTITVLRDYLIRSKWKKVPLFLHEITSDVLNLTYGEIIDYLRLENIFHAKEESLHQIFSNLI